MGYCSASSLQERKDVSRADVFPRLLGTKQRLPRRLLLRLAGVERSGGVSLDQPFVCLTLELRAAITEHAPSATGKDPTEDSGTVGEAMLLAKGGSSRVP